MDGGGDCKMLIEQTEPLKALVFGAKGYFGNNISSGFKTIQTIPDSKTDITKIDDVVNSILFYNPDICINAGAKVNEDLAEENMKYWSEMLNVNVLGAINVLKACEITDKKLTHLRTPFETEVLDDYSLGKASAYQFIKADKYKHMVLAVSPGWAFGGINSRQFDALLIRSIKEKIPLGITNNSYCFPIYMPNFISKLEQVILKGKLGHINIAGIEKATRYEFAKCLARHFGKTMRELNWREDNNFKESARRPSLWGQPGVEPSYKDAMKDFVKKNF